jgi:hypothetical protein
MEFTYNGKTIKSENGDINIQAGRVIVDGKDITDELGLEGSVIELVIHGDIAGDVSCDGSVRVYGDIVGDVAVGGTVKCTDITGDVSVGDSVKCEDVIGSIRAGGNVVVKGNAEE